MNSPLKVWHFEMIKFPKPLGKHLNQIHRTLSYPCKYIEKIEQMTNDVQKEKYTFHKALIRRLKCNIFI